MSATATALNGLVLAGEGFGYNYGIQTLPAAAPPGTRKMRIAFRMWVEGIANGTTAYYTYVPEEYYSANAYGLSWLNQVPYQKNEDTTSAVLHGATEDETFAAFIGVITGNSYYASNQSRNIQYFDRQLATNLAAYGGGDWGAGSEYIGMFAGYAGTYLLNSYFKNGASLTDGNDRSSGMFGSDYYLEDTYAYLKYLPMGSTFGNTVTIGWEFSANELDKKIVFRHHWDHSGLAEGSLIDVFDTAPRLAYTTFLGDEVSQWRPDLTTFNWPNYFVARLGHPEAELHLKAYSVAYYDIDGDPLL